MPLASTVMAEVAALMNDTGQRLYTNSVILPYLKSAWNGLQLELMSNGIPVSKEISLVTQVLANSDSITPPSDFLQPIRLEERPSGSSDVFVEVEEKQEIPQVSSERILYWNWREEVVYINPPSTNREIRLTYWKSLNPLNDQNSNLNVANSLEYLAYRTAALCARYVGENPSRAQALDAEAFRSLQLLINLEVRKLQSFPVRPRGYGRKRWQLL